MAVLLAIYQSIRSLLERREKYYIGERKILNNRKVVDGELAHLCPLYTIVVENFPEWSAAIYVSIRPLGRRESLPLALVPNVENDNRHIFSYFAISSPVLSYLPISFNVNHILAYIYVHLMQHCKH